MEDPRETLVINARIEITSHALETIVKNAKRLAGKDSRGRYQVDTAEQVGRMISRFLFEKDFDSFVEDIANYS